MSNKLGSLPDSVDARDAFHMACVSVTCDEKVLPGDDVMFLNHQCTHVAKCDKNKRHAIVDPFLVDVNKNKAFWAVLCPDSTANLTHHFDIVVNGVIQRPPESVASDDDWDNGCRGCN